MQDLVVELLDASAPMLERAAERCPASPAHLADICTFDLEKTFDVVACRGVLNDILTDPDRDAALESLALHVAVGGSLCLDVRERDASRMRAPNSRRQRVSTIDGEVIFESRSKWDDPFLVIDETHTGFITDAEPRVDHYVFRMRPWTEGELLDGLSRVGLVDIDIRSGGRATNDHLVVSAHCRHP